MTVHICIMLAADCCTLCMDLREMLHGYTYRTGTHYSGAICIQPFTENDSQRKGLVLKPLEVRGEAVFVARWRE